MAQEATRVNGRRGYGSCGRGRPCTRTGQQGAPAEAVARRGGARLAGRSRQVEASAGGGGSRDGAVGRGRGHELASRGAALGARADEAPASTAVAGVCASAVALGTTEREGRWRERGALTAVAE